MFKTHTRTTVIKTHSKCKIQITANYLTSTNFPPEPWLSLTLPSFDPPSSFSIPSLPPVDTQSPQRATTGHVGAEIKSRKFCHNNSLLSTHKNHKWAKRKTNQSTLGPTTNHGQECYNMFSYETRCTQHHQNNSWINLLCNWAADCLIFIIIATTLTTVGTTSTFYTNS